MANMALGGSSFMVCHGVFLVSSSCYMEPKKAQLYTGMTTRYMLCICIHVCASLQASTASDMNAHMLYNYLCTWYIFFILEAVDIYTFLGQYFCSFLHKNVQLFKHIYCTYLFVILTKILWSVFIFFIYVS